MTVRSGLMCLAGLFAGFALVAAAHAQDFANLGRFAAENAALAPAKPGEHRVVFFGDSITEYWSGRHGAFFAGKPYVNRGISGQTTPQMVLRFEQDVVALHPDVVVLLAGINDIAQNTGPETPETIHNNFRAMAAMAKAAHVRMVLCSVLPANVFPWRAEIKPAVLVQDLNTWLRGFAAAEKLVYVDYYPAMVDPQQGLRAELGADAVHPNAAGYAVMEPLVEAGIAKALAQKKP